MSGIKPSVLFGFSLYETWKYLVLFLGSSFAHQVNRIVSLTILVICLIVLLRCCSVILQSQLRIRLCILAATALLVASAILTAYATPQDVLALHIVSGISSGIGAALLDVLWISRFSSCTQKQFLFFAVCFIFAQSLLTCLIVSFPSDTLPYALSLPILSGVLLWLSSGKATPLSNSPSTPTAWYGTAWGVFGLSIGVLCTLSQTMSDKDMATSPWILAITLTVLVLFFYLNLNALRGYMRNHDREALATVLMLPLLVVIIMGAPYVFNDYPELQNVRVAGSFALWELFLVYIAVTASQRLNASPVKLYLQLSIGRSTGVVVGTGITYILTTYLATDNDLIEQIAMAVVVLACQTMLALSFMISKRNIDNQPRTQPKQSLDLASSLLAKRYLLTSREEEILALVAKGRTVSRIAEELFISPNTVTTHMNHIYKKCDVHTKQQLLDLCESALSEGD